MDEAARDIVDPDALSELIDNVGDEASVAVKPEDKERSKIIHEECDKRWNNFRLHILHRGHWIYQYYVNDASANDWTDDEVGNFQQFGRDLRDCIHAAGITDEEIDRFGEVYSSYRGIDEATDRWIRETIFPKIEFAFQAMMQKGYSREDLWR